MVKRIVLYIVLVLCANISVSAQNVNSDKQQEKLRQKTVKKELAQASAILKSGNNLEKLETSMRNLLKDSVSRQDLRIHYTLIESLKKQYAQGNEKMFLKEKYDTVKLFDVCERMFEAAAVMDSVDANVSSKQPKYRKQHSSMLVPYYSNLYVASVFYANKQNWKKTLEMAELYLNARNWPLFSSTAINLDSLREAHTSYLAFYSSYRMDDYKNSLKYVPKALSYQPRIETTLRSLTYVYESLGDTANYVDVLKRGTALFPSSQFFYSRLINHYCQNGLLREALKQSELSIKADSLNEEIKVVRHTLLLNLADYKECERYGKELLAANDSLSEVCYNMALVYFNQANALSDSSVRSKAKDKEVTALLRKCRPYMEKFRALEPEAKDKWRPVLYMVYLNLNLGKEFAEIEAIK